MEESFKICTDETIREEAEAESKWENIRRKVVACNQGYEMNYTGVAFNAKSYEDNLPSSLAEATMAGIRGEIWQRTTLTTHLKNRFR